MNVFIVAAMTANGYIARQHDELADWTSKEDKKLFVELTKRAGVMVMGRTTYETIGRPLPGRRTIVLSRSGFTAEGVEVTSETPQQLVARLEVKGCRELAVCGGAAIYKLFLEAGVVDELYLTVEPLLFADGVALAAGTEARLQLVETHEINDNAVLLHYEVQK